jgi:hypothetical protein
MSLRRDPQLPPVVNILEALDGQGRIIEDADPAPKIAWRDNTMVFRYMARGSRWTDDIGYQVRLIGLEDDWRTTDFTEARYPGLAAGSYRFEARSQSVTMENGPIASGIFRILAPWWRRWWMQLCGRRFWPSHLRGHPPPDDHPPPPETSFWNPWSRPARASWNTSNEALKGSGPHRSADGALQPALPDHGPCPRRRSAAPDVPQLPSAR